MDIRLDGPPVDPDGSEVGWWRDGLTVTVRAEHSLSTYRLPKGVRRVTMVRYGEGRTHLAMGGFKSATVTLIGDRDVLAAIREELLAT